MPRPRNRRYFRFHLPDSHTTARREAPSRHGYFLKRSSKARRASVGLEALGAAGVFFA